MRKSPSIIGYELACLFMQLQFPDRPYNRLREKFPERPSLLSGRQGLSTDGYDLLNRMLHLCPDHRISAEDARNHPW